MASLNSVLIPSKSAEFDFPGIPGFVLKLKTISREELVKMRKKATKVVFKGGRNPEETFDEELFLKLYADTVIEGWTGLKFGDLGNLVLVDLGNVNPEDELAYSKEDALLLMKSSSDFDRFITDTINGISNFMKSSSK